MDDGQQQLVGHEGSAAVRWLNSFCSLRQDGELFSVWFAGTPLLRFRGRKSADALLAAALVAEVDGVRVGAVLDAFGVDDVTLLRARRRLNEGGAGAVIAGAKRGPKGPMKLVPAKVRRIRELFVQGLDKKSIGHRLGVSDFSVRQAVKGMEVPTSTAPEQPQLTLDIGNEAPEGPLVEESQSPVVEAEAPHGEFSSSVADDVGLEPTQEQPAQLAGQSEPPQAGTPHVPVRAASQEEATVFAMLNLTPDGEAETVLESVQNLPNAGVLLAVPAMQKTGLLEAAREVYSRMKSGVYGLRATILLLTFMALLRRPRPEHLKGMNPAALGDIVGLLRAPEVKTVRRKLLEIATRRESHELVKALARRWLVERKDELGILLIDGHVRVYTGKQKLPKAHVTQRNLCEPATTDYWVNDIDGNPVFVITAEANAAMTKVLPLLLDEIEAELGERRGTLVFDRGGWKLELFRELLRRGWNILTYRKGKKRKHTRKGFTKQSMTIDGKTVEYTLSEKNVRLSKGLKLREIAILRADGRQTKILTSHEKEKHPAVHLAYRMFGRWRQENYFKYMEENFALDALVDYDFEQDNPDRSVPNPERKKLDKTLKEARANLTALEREYGAEALDNEEAKRRTMRGFKIANGALGQRVKAARDQIELLTQRRKKVPTHVPVGSLRPADEILRLSTERKIFTDAIKASAYRAESMLVGLLRPHFKRADDEARAFLKIAFEQPADLIVNGDEVTVRFGQLSAPRFTAALRDLCSELNKLQPRFPESTYRLKYEVVEAGPTGENPS